jgi:hypothetical protein
VKFGREVHNKDTRMSILCIKCCLQDSVVTSMVTVQDVKAMSDILNTESVLT